MRMWMIAPALLCRKHLLGEHGELHKFLHNWKKRRSLDGYITSNAIEPLSYKKRHDELAEELLLRNYQHNSPLEQPDFSYLPPQCLNYQIDVNKSIRLLQDRCPDCSRRIK